MAPLRWRGLHHRRAGEPRRVAVSAGLVLAFVITAMIGAVLERTLYVHVYAKSHLDQVLFTIGLVFMSVAGVDFVMGSSQQFVQIPAALQGRSNIRRRRRALPPADHRGLRAVDGTLQLVLMRHAFR